MANKSYSYIRLIPLILRLGFHNPKEQLRRKCYSNWLERKSNIFVKLAIKSLTEGQKEEGNATKTRHLISAPVKLWIYIFA